MGDTFGETFFGPPEKIVPRILAREIVPGPWKYTDDTEMALSIHEQLAERGEIDQDDLAKRFATRMEYGRGYGKNAYEILEGLKHGGSWRALTRSGFRGMGSFGNGAAMRVGPLGGYFADATLERIAEQARLSAEVTHAHDEGVAGAIAVAVASALAYRRRSQAGALGAGWLDEVRDATPAGFTRDAIDEARGIPATTNVVDAAIKLGNGSGVTAPDTVPLCLWVAAHRADFADALWTTVGALGDRDTTCAIVGSILALKCGRDAIPAAWLDAREPLPI